jgi:antitoxin component YwqK of YwqJK toxin-antitoxin module
MQSIFLMQVRRLSKMTIIKGLKITIGVILGAIAIYIGTITYLVQKMKYERRATKEMLVRLDHQCPEGTKDITQEGGKTGAVRYCEKNGVKHGKIVVWTNQRPAWEGYYNEGKQHGSWKYFHEDGRVYRVVEYKNGVEVADKIIDPRESIN